MVTWIALAISLLLLLVISQRNLAVGMFVAATVLGLTTLSFQGFFDQVVVTFSDPSVVSLAGLVAIIAMVGGVLEESGEMENLVTNMRIGKRPFLGASPALLGMLPMPGGALLSAPMVESSGDDLSGSTKAVINVWFRHILFLIYPLGPALIASAKIARLNVYSTIPYLAPFFLLSVVLGYFFMLRETKTKMEYSSDFSLRGLLVPLAVILMAPIADIVLKTFFNFPVPEYTTLIGVSLSFIAAIMVSRYGLSELKKVTVKMEPWGYALIVLGMFTFLNVFKVSGAPEAIAELAFPLPVLVVVVSFLLGLATGRIQAPASIIFPIFFARQGVGTMPLVAFAMAYFSIFIGYAISPIHPCVSVSVEYFETSMGSYVRKIALPGVISLVVVGVLSVFLM
jgi:integral membrane protein (TIGR00529 family)